MVTLDQGIAFTLMFLTLVLIFYGAYPIVKDGSWVWALGSIIAGGVISCIMLTFMICQDKKNTN